MNQQPHCVLFGNQVGGRGTKQIDRGKVRVHRLVCCSVPPSSYPLLSVSTEWRLRSAVRSWQPCRNNTTWYTTNTITKQTNSGAQWSLDLKAFLSAINPSVYPSIHPSLYPPLHPSALTLLWSLFTSSQTDSCPSLFGSKVRLISGLKSSPVWSIVTCFCDELNVLHRSDTAEWACCRRNGPKAGWSHLHPP